MISITEAKQKREERAARFGIETKDVRNEKIKKRMERFEIETKESLKAKKLARMARFGVDKSGAQENGDDPVRKVMPVKEIDPETAAKHKERLEKFGPVDEKYLNGSSDDSAEKKRDRKFKNKKSLVLNKKFVEAKLKNGGKQGGNRQNIVSGGNG